MAALADSVRCCGITRQGEQCARVTRTPYYYGRCSIHHGELTNNGAHAQAIEEYKHIVHALKLKYKPVFPTSRLAEFEKSQLEPYINTLPEGEKRYLNMTPFIAAIRSIFELEKATPPIRRTGDAEKDYRASMKIKQIQQLAKQSYDKHMEELHQANRELAIASKVQVDAVSTLYKMRKSGELPAPPSASSAPTPISSNTAFEMLKELRVKRYRMVFHTPSPDTLTDNITEDNVQHHDIHDKFVEKKIVTIVQNLLLIDVPEEYQWNDNIMSSTLPDILLHCSLPIETFKDISSRYTSSAQMFVPGPGIYGRVLDALWTYINNSSDKHQLRDDLRNALIDSNGLCLQGAIGRLCSVVVNRIEDIIPPESSPTNYVKMEIPRLREISDREQRIKSGKHLLLQHNIPRSEWKDWLVPLN